MEIELPFKAEYARSGRAACKGCKTTIPQGTLRLAAMVQSAFHDSKQPNWFHESCFFQKQRPAALGDIDNISNLKFSDQERLKKKIDELTSAVTVATTAKGKGKKRSKTENAILKDFGVEYAKSGRAVCRGCEQKLLKDQIRIRKTVYDTEVGMKYGGQPLWHHVECFAKLRIELGWLVSGDALPGFENLKEEDQAEVKKAIPLIASEEGPSVKKVKTESEIKEEKESEEHKANLKKQSDQLFMFRQLIKERMKKPDIIALLEYNGQDPVIGDTGKLIDQLADILTFGAIATCSNCKGNQMLFQGSGYICNGDLTEWTKCLQLVKEPERAACKIPKHFISNENYDFLKKVPKKPKTRLVSIALPSAKTLAMAVKKEDVTDGPKISRERPPLYEWRFAHIGLKAKESELKSRLMKLGGVLDTKITSNTVGIFSTAEEIKRNNSRMQKAMQMGIHIIPTDYLDAVENKTSDALTYISTMSLCDWGTDPSARIKEADTKSKSKSIYTKSVPKSVKLKIKGGIAVDPDSGLEEIAHIYCENKKFYNAVLGLTDIQRNKNSYYKLQLLESDAKNRYWVFRSWGRIGTTIGGSKLDNFPNLMSAKRSFEEVYQEKSGNDFYTLEFEKVPGRMYPIDVEYADKEEVANLNDNTIKSTLDPSVQSLIKLLFDIESMKRTMLEFDLDLEKMPLGKLSQKQIQSAYKVLTELSDLISKGVDNKAKFIDASNRFYTLIPHNFGVENPPLLKTDEQIQHFRIMLDSLLEIECAYSMLKTDEKNTDKNPVDVYYEQLKTKIEPLSKESDEFNLLKEYVQNTHAETHKMYDLEIVDIFKVNRQGETRRYKPFKKLHNRKLLWHGSRLTNFAGILSHGLKIAPEEAPVTGYMFGKGIYFADMVSKSANYCCTSQANPTGLLILSEVALGDMMECTTSKYVTKLPSGKQSCFGKGRTMPDPKESYIREDGVEIPKGKPITDTSLKSQLLYNEYIVYDIAQVNIQYLLRMNFKYKY